MEPTSEPFATQDSANRERGASAVEYGLLIAGIAALIALAVYLLGAQVFDLFDNTCQTLAGQMGETC